MSPRPEPPFVSGRLSVDVWPASALLLGEGALVDADVTEARAALRVGDTRGERLAAVGALADVVAALDARWDAGATGLTVGNEVQLALAIGLHPLPVGEDRAGEVLEVPGV